MFHRPFLAALLVSVALHGLLLGAGELVRLLGSGLTPGPLPPRLEARLLPARPSEAGLALLKDTLAESAVPLPASGAPPLATAARGSARKTAPEAGRALQRAAQRKLAEHMFYPSEAIARGLEGEVRLLLTLGPDGAILDARVASGSGHRLLDEAAVSAALAMRRLPDAGVVELILPVVFKLQ